MNAFSLADLFSCRPYRSFLCWLCLACGGFSAAHAGVYLSSTNFSASNLPSIYTDEGMPATYRLRCKFQPGDYHCTQAWNNNWQQLQSVPSPGNYTAEVYWLKYDDNGTLIEIGPFNVYSVTVQAANSSPQAQWVSAPSTTPGQTITLTGSAHDDNGNLQYMHFYVNDSNWSGWNYAGTANISGADATGSVNWTAPGAPRGTYTAHIRIQDSTGAWDAGGVTCSFAVKYYQASVSSQSASINFGSSFTPAYFGGSGSGGWQFVVGGYTNWHDTTPGTLLPPNNAQSASWTPSSPGSYQFWVRKITDNDYHGSNIAGPYTLSVNTTPSCSISANPLSIVAGQTTTIAVNAAHARYINVDQTSPNGGYYGAVSSGTENPPNGAHFDLGSLNASYTRNLPLTLNTPGTYTFRGAVGEGTGWYYSSGTVSVTVTAPQPPSISAHPQSQTVGAGQNATFSVAVTGSAPFSYQWQKNGVNIAGANAASYTVTNAQSGDVGGYSVMVSNSAGSVFSNAATLAVTALSPIRLALQYWQANDYPNYEAGHYETVWVDGHWEYNWTYNWDDPEWWNTGHYEEQWVEGHDEEQWIVDNTYVDGQYGSSWTTNVGTFNINNASSGCTASSTNRGSVIHSYTPYQWITFRTWGLAPSGNCNTYQGRLYDPAGNNIQTGNFSSNSYWQGNFYPTSNGIYRVEISYSNATGGANPTSAVVKYYFVVGNVAPAIVTQPAGQAVNAGATVIFTTEATGTPTLTYQWKKDGTNIPSATNATLTLTNVQPAAAGSYTVAVSNSVGSITSNAATLTVNGPPPPPPPPPGSQNDSSNQNQLNVHLPLLP